LDPLVLEPTIIKDEVERQMPEAKEALSPNPVTLKNRRRQDKAQL